MAENKGPSMNSLINSSSLLQKLASTLPKGVNFNIYHLSTPPTKASALYSAPPGARPDRTYCESHFLSASIQAPNQGDASDSAEVLIFAIEILIYSTAHDSTFFVSKADSTGFLHLLNLPKGTPSPLREISTTFLQHLVEQRQRPNIRSVVSLFARAQDQYLFPGSIEYSGKHVLDDRGLVRWWCRVLDPLLGDIKINAESASSQWQSVEGYLVVPGLDTHETRSYIPKGTIATWTTGHPLYKITRHSADVPPRCLIPHFPDDPKARFLDELDEELSKGQDAASGQWKSVKSIDQFWDMMAFRQECSAGRLVGFIWIVFTPVAQYELTQSLNGDSQNTTMTMESQPLDSDSFTSIPSQPASLVMPSTSFTASSQPQASSSPIKSRDEFPSASQRSVRSISSTSSKRRKLTGPIIARQPRVKTQNKNYLLDYPTSSAYYEWREEGRGQVIVDESDYKRVTELLLRLDFANLELASSSSTRWISEVRSGAMESMGEAWGQVIMGTKALEIRKENAGAGVNTLSRGLVRTKRKADGDKSKDASSIDPALIPASAGAPIVNVLSAGMIRKKAKT
ncbi:histone acetylation protein-domain-containing protein [Bisporella sp. PMI_857]|nr:histone acetylation protein-domain-containing protein [Bisporella sp. PMI_857]